jgi:hypothetical protein
VREKLVGRVRSSVAACVGEGVWVRVEARAGARVRDRVVEAL